VENRHVAVVGELRRAQWQHSRLYIHIFGPAPGLITYDNLGRLRGHVSGGRGKDKILHGMEGVEVTKTSIAMKKVVRV